MAERLTLPSGFNDRPPHEAGLPMTDDQARDFKKQAGYWSREPESSVQSEAATTQYMGEFAPHRAVTRIVRTRASSLNGVQYVRGGVTVICKSADDYASLRVERRVATDDPAVDKITRSEYLINGPDREAFQLSWLVRRETGERIELLTSEELVGEFEPMFAIGDKLEEDAGATVDIMVSTEPEDDAAFTRGRAWETEDVFAELAEEGWARSPVEHKINPRATQAGPES